jgi:hypothetical protein
VGGIEYLEIAFDFFAVLQCRHYAKKPEERDYHGCFGDYPAC